MPVQVWPLSVVIVGYNSTYRVERTPVTRSCLAISKKNMSLHLERSVRGPPCSNPHVSGHESMGKSCRVLAARRRRSSTKRATLGWLGVDDCRLFGYGSGWWLLMIGKWKARNKNVVCFAWFDLKPKKSGQTNPKKTKKISSGCWFCENHSHIKCLFHVIQLG